MRVGIIIQKWRTMKERGLRDVAAEIGVSASTLSRLENGKNIEGQALVKILNWLLSKEESQQVARAD